MTDQASSTRWIAFALVAIEAVLTMAVVLRVSYTEIDWKAYMQEVEGVIVDGERDYTKLAGDTGPLVYPGGFVFVYSALYWATNSGTDIFRGQLIFVGLYLANLAVVLSLYRTSTKVPTWAWVTLCLSKRIHSIFVLRLFNDPVAMFFVYVAIVLAVQDRWMGASICFSFAVSVKMNVLLMAPGFGLLLVERFGLMNIWLYMTIMVLVQALVGSPFLLHNWWSYFSRAFEFSRQFLYVWTVNWKFLPERIFLDQRFAVALLCLHLSVLASFFFSRWIKATGNTLTALLLRHRPTSRPTFLTSDRILTVLFTCNIVGVVFARSLHFQFYAWYFHMLPYLAWQTRLPTWLRLGLLLAIEYCWNVYPSNAITSGTLFGCHCTLLLALLLFPIQPEDQKKSTVIRKTDEKT